MDQAVVLTCPIIICEELLVLLLIRIRLCLDYERYFVVLVDKGCSSRIYTLGRRGGVLGTPYSFSKYAYGGSLARSPSFLLLFPPATEVCIIYNVLLIRLLGHWIPFQFEEIICVDLVAHV